MIRYLWFNSMANGNRKFIFKANSREIDAKEFVSLEDLKSDSYKELYKYQFSDEDMVRYIGNDGLRFLYIIEEDED